MPESAGLYFSWGNTNGHPTGEGYDFSRETYNTTPGASIAEDLSLSQDAARVILGAPCRMPTDPELQELVNTNNTEFIDASGNVISGDDKRTTYNGVVGLLLRSKTNGNTLFLPSAGYYSGTTLFAMGSNGTYWSSTIFSESDAYRLTFNSTGVGAQSHLSRYFGYTVRAVKDGTPNRSIVPPTPDKEEETPTVEEPKDDNER